MKVICSDAAMRPTDQRLFPVSRHRSPRVLKKLLMRFSGLYKMEPCIVRYGDLLVAHPTLYAKLKHELSGTQDRYDCNPGQTQGF